MNTELYMSILVFLGALLVAVAVTGDWAKRLPGGTVKADGYTWAQIALDKDAASHAHGWVATEYIELG